MELGVLEYIKDVLMELIKMEVICFLILVKTYGS